MFVENRMRDYECETMESMITNGSQTCSHKVVPPIRYGSRWPQPPDTEGCGHRDPRPAEYESNK